jgi:O-antigen ligase
MREGRRRRLLLAILTAAGAVVLWMAPATLAAQGQASGGDGPAPAIAPNRELVAFLQTPAGVMTVAASLALGGLAWSVVAVRALERRESTPRAPMTRSARKRARKRPVVAGRAAALESTRILAGLVSAASLILPLTFSVVINDNVFALPKTVGLWAFAAIIGIALIVLVLAGARPPRPGVLELSAAAFVGLMAIATLTSVDRGVSIVGEHTHYQGLASTVAYVLLFVAAVVAITTVPRGQVLALAILTSATVAAVYAVAQWLGLDLIWEELYKDRVFSTVGQANALATTLAAGTILALALFPAAGRPQRAAIVGCVALCVAGLLLTFSRGGYVAFMLGLVVAGVVVISGTGRVALRRWVGPLFAGTSVAVLVVGLLAVTWRPVGELVERVAARTASIADASEGSNRRHIELWTVGLTIAFDHPVIGTGPDTYAVVFPEYRDVVLSPEGAERMARFRPESPHNVYLAIASGAGFPTLLAFVVLVGSCLGLGLRAARRAAMPARFALGALLGAVTVHLVAMSFMTAEPATFALFWIMLGALAGLGRRFLATALDEDVAAGR